MAKTEFVRTKATRMGLTQPFEEERLPWYEPDQFYLVRIGEMLDNKYKVVPQLSLEESEKALDGDDKERFLKFTRSMLKWLPEERTRASELLKDPWLEGAIP